MSVYKFLISKNNIARDSDANITYDDPNGGEDVDVTLTVNGTEIHAATLVDAGCVLTYTGTLSEGYHTVKIQPEAGKPTDIRIDHVLIDDNRVVGSQYKMDTRIFGKSDDYLKYKSCIPFRAPKDNDYVWWGTVYNSDFTVVSNTAMYRPHVVTDTGQWWEWSFSVTSNGHIHWTLDDSDSILYDSTENHTYYAAKSILTTDSSVYPITDHDEVDNFNSTTFDSTWDSTEISLYAGQGKYNDNFVQIASGDSGEGPDHIAIYSSNEWYDALWYYRHYWPANDIDPIVIT